MKAPSRTTFALVIVALAQTGALGMMVADRLLLLRTGREITLPIIPVDPRDFFRGEYVRLGYDIGRVPPKLIDGPPPRANSAFYVVLERKDGVWRPAKVTRALPKESGSDRIVLKARSDARWQARDTNTPQPVRYGIESYFVPEGQGKRLEDLAREKKLAALLAVDRGGNAAIKGIIIDGQLQYVEPVF